MENKKKQKLSLKRKAAPLDFCVKRSKGNPECESNGREEPQISSDDGNAVRKGEIIHLSSDSDVEVNHEKSEVLPGDDIIEYSEKDETDMALLEIRQALRKFWKRTAHINRELKPLPCHPQITKCDVGERKTAPEFNASEYIPLPKLCKLCRKIRPARVVFPVLDDGLKRQIPESSCIISSNSSQSNLKVAVKNSSTLYEDLPSSFASKKSTEPQTNTKDVTKQSTSDVNFKQSTQATEVADVIPGSPIPNRKRSLFAKKSLSTSDAVNHKSLSNASICSASCSGVKANLNNEKLYSTGLNILSEKTKMESQIACRQNTKNVSVATASGMKDLQGGDNSVSECPMCGLQFKSSMTSIEKDGHIASCLSAAEDDIMW